MAGKFRISEADVARAVAGCLKGGMLVGSVEVQASGAIVVRSLSEAGTESSPNPWDKILERRADAVPKS